MKSDFYMTSWNGVSLKKVQFSTQFLTKISSWTRLPVFHNFQCGPYTITLPNKIYSNIIECRNFYTDGLLFPRLITRTNCTHFCLLRYLLFFESEVMLNFIYFHLISYRDLICIVCVQNKLNSFKLECCSFILAWHDQTHPSTLFT